MRHDDKKIASVDKGVNVYEHKISKLRFFKVFSGDPSTGWGNTFYKKGGEDITDLFIEDKQMAGIADHQIDSQRPLVADFNGDGIDDVYISSAMHTGKSSSKDGFFGGWHLLSISARWYF